ncbi:hypothetical protein [Dysgonomonas sp. 511]|uniref:hypothetical protein n=1 Tax=Dysgonomonas sp. 511 TaxID=2302930 RepID=UPI0013D67CD7|nr:hypothetical protein [Dysgonomonas sp. 511]NDV80259.1 hypothetical protein [Dysgonomonas sp. 511]
MKRAFLYIDILGFESMVKSKSNKVDKIFEIIDSLNVFKHESLQVIVFSDTILVFNRNENWPTHYYVTYLIEYAQELFYKLNWINVFFKGIITYGEFHFKELRNFQAYYGEALIDTYKDESGLNGFGLYIDKRLHEEVIVFNKITLDEKYDYVLLCQSFVNLYRDTKGLLPINIDMLHETDTYFRIDEDLRFFREIEYLKNNYPIEKVQKKYQAVYDLYKNCTPDFFDVFETDGFLPLSLNECYTGSINFTEILAEKELSQ